MSKKGLDSVVIDGVDMFDVIRFIRKKNKRFLANILSTLEMVIPPDSSQFVQVRKLILDGMNDYTRSILMTLFGDIEGLD